jgi:hypothetical protein
VNETQEIPMKKKKHAWIFIILVLLVVFYFVFGFMTIQPIGAIPDGITLLVIRAGTQLKFFDSPDALCERLNGEVSLLCRGMAMGLIAENATIVLRLPYIDTFYLASTGGVTYLK